MKYPPITAELLKSKKACYGQVELFKDYFWNSPAPLTEEVFTKFASQFDIDWAAMHLLDSTDLAEYDKVQRPAWDEYAKVTVPALTEFLKVRDTAWAEYDKVKTLAWTEYLRISDPAWVEYEKVKAPAWAEYDKVTALAFLKLYTAD